MVNATARTTMEQPTSVSRTTFGVASAFWTHYEVQPVWHRQKVATGLTTWVPNSKIPRREPCLLSYESRSSWLESSLLAD